MFADILPQSVIKRLSLRVKELGGINLGQGIPSFPTASHIRDAVRVALDEPAIGVYPNFLGEIELRSAIAEKLNRDHHLSLTEKNILITVGAMEATATAILSLIETGGKVGVVTPDYCNHFPQVQLAKGTVVEIPMREHEVWELDLASIEAELQKGIRLVILTNPNNPTGAVIGKSELAALVALIETYGSYLLVDETYSFLSYDEPFTSLLDVWSKSSRLLVVRSFSKEYAMTGWRVGYIVGQPETIASFSRTHDALVGCAPKISQRAALAAITGPQNIVATYISALHERRDIVMQRIGDIPAFACVSPKGAYYAFPRYTGTIPSDVLSTKILEESKVAVVPGNVFGAAGESHIRISFAVETAVLEEGMNKLKEYFSS